MLNQNVSRPQLQVQFNWKIAIAVLLLFAVLMRLGFWQLDRAEQKRQAQNDRDTRHSTLPVALETLSLTAKNTLKYTKVGLTGRYDNAKSILVRNQVFQGHPGYEVITLFKLHANNQQVLVSRGWIAMDYKNQQLPTIAAITKTQHLVGEIHISPEQSFFLPQKFDDSATWPLSVHHFDINQISQLFDSPVLPFIVRLDENNPGVLIRHWPIKRFQATNSTSYALQWFAMGFILIIITIVKSTNIRELIASKKSIH